MVRSGLAQAKLLAWARCHVRVHATMAFKRCKYARVPFCCYGIVLPLVCCSAGCLTVRVRICVLCSAVAAGGLVWLHMSICVVTRAEVQRYVALWLLRYGLVVVCRGLVVISSLRWFVAGRTSWLGGLTLITHTGVLLNASKCDALLICCCCVIDLCCFSLSVSPSCLCWFVSGWPTRPGSLECLDTLV